MKTRFYACVLAMLSLAGASAHAQTSSGETHIGLSGNFGWLYVPPARVTLPPGELVMLYSPELGPGLQWYKDGQPVPDATSSWLTFVAKPSDSGQYLAKLANGYGSSQLNLTIRPPNYLINLSTRGYVGPGEQTLIGGFTVGGTDTKTLLIRAVGPTLSTLGVKSVLPDPEILLFDSKGQLYTEDFIYPAVVGAIEEAIKSATQAVGAFPLPAGSKDAVALRPFKAGGYTVHVRSKSDAVGIALLEIYEVP